MKDTIPAKLSLASKFRSIKRLSAYKIENDKSIKSAENASGRQRNDQRAMAYEFLSK